MLLHSSMCFGDGVGLFLQLGLTKGAASCLATGSRSRTSRRLLCLRRSYSRPVPFVIVLAGHSLRVRAALGVAITRALVSVHAVPLLQLRILTPASSSSSLLSSITARRRRRDIVPCRSACRREPMASRGAEGAAWRLAFDCPTFFFLLGSSLWSLHFVFRPNVCIVDQGHKRASYGRESRASGEEGAFRRS